MIAHLSTFQLLLATTVAIVAAFFIRELVAVAGSLTALRSGLRTALAILAMAAAAALLWLMIDHVVAAAVEHFLAINLCAGIFLLIVFRRCTRGRPLRRRDPHVPLTAAQRAEKLELDRLACQRLQDHWTRL